MIRLIYLWPKSKVASSIYLLQIAEGLGPLEKPGEMRPKMTRLRRSEQDRGMIPRPCLETEAWDRDHVSRPRHDTETMSRDLTFLPFFFLADFWKRFRLPLGYLFSHCLVDKVWTICAPAWFCIPKRKCVWCDYHLPRLQLMDTIRMTV